jgi:hypothetical protein
LLQAFVEFSRRVATQHALSHGKALDAVESVREFLMVAVNLGVHSFNCSPDFAQQPEGMVFGFCHGHLASQTMKIYFYPMAIKYRS